MAARERTGKLCAMSRPGCYVTDGTALFFVLQPLAHGVVALENAGSLEVLLMPAEQVGRLKRVKPLTDPPHDTNAHHPRRRRVHPFRTLRTLLRALAGRRVQMP